MIFRPIPGRMSLLWNSDEDEAFLPVSGSDLSCRGVFAASGSHERMSVGTDVFSLSKADNDKRSASLPRPSMRMGKCPTVFFVPSVRERLIP